MKILAIDWGLATGLATYDNGVHEAWTEAWDVALYITVRNMIESGSVDLVFMENFLISERTTRTAVAKDWSRGRELELIGATKYLCTVHGAEYKMQTPAQAKDFASDTKLKRIGWYTPGPDHSRDASRHLLLGLVSRRLIDASVLLSQDS